MNTDKPETPAKETRADPNRTAALHDTVDELFDYFHPESTRYTTSYDSRKLKKYHMGRRKQVKTSRGDRIRFEEKDTMQPANHVFHESHPFHGRTATSVTATSLHVAPAKNEFPYDSFTTYKAKRVIRDEPMLQTHLHADNSTTIFEKIGGDHNALYQAPDFMEAEAARDIMGAFETLHDAIIEDHIESQLPSPKQRI